MIWKIDTKKVAGVHRVTCVKLISAKRNIPDYILESGEAIPIFELLDDNGKLQWEIVSNPNYIKAMGPQKDNRPFILQHAIQELSEQEQKEKKDRERRNKVRRLVSIEDLVDAVILLAEGDTSKVEQLKERIQ